MERLPQVRAVEPEAGKGGPTSSGERKVNLDCDPWSLSRVAAVLFFVAYLILQTAIPLRQLASSEPARFGWQMYSRARIQPEFALVTPAGEVPVEMERYLLRLRREIAFERYLPPHLCRVHPEASAVVVRRMSETSVRVPCP